MLCRKCHAREHGKISAEWNGMILHRDDRFLDNAIRLYPPDPKDRCVEFHVGHVRDMNVLQVEIGFKSLDEKDW